MIETLRSALPSELLILAQERRQLERLQVMTEQKLRRIGHGRPRQQTHVGSSRRHRDVRPRQIGIDRHVEARWSPFDVAQHQVLHCVESDCSARDGVAPRR